MARLHESSSRGGRARRHPRSWGSVLRGILRWLAFLMVVAETLALLLDGAAGSWRSAALGPLVLLVVSLAYLGLVSSHVYLRIPGMERGALKRWGRGAPPDGVATVQVTRLDGSASSVTVENDAYVPALRVQVTLAIATEGSAKDADAVHEERLFDGAPFSVPARGSVRSAATATFEHVGVYRLSFAGVRVWDLIGLLSRTRSLPDEWRMRVVPNLYRLTRGVPRNRKVLQASLGVPDAPSDALDYDRVRAYQPGDPLKAIHWKIVAHSQGELFTKLFETATATSVTLVVDPALPRGLEGSPDLACHLYDTMLEGGFSLLEHVREGGIAGRLRFAGKDGKLIETHWEGPATLGWFVETARRPSAAPDALATSVQALGSLRDAQVGYAIVATGGLNAQSVRELLACHHAGVPLVVVHALPGAGRSGRAGQDACDARLREAGIDVIALTDGAQIVREVSAR